jgi:hypothetical protein
MDSNPLIIAMLISPDLDARNFSGHQCVARSRSIYTGLFAQIILDRSCHAGLFRQTKHALRNNVCLDLVAAAVNGGRLGVQPFFHAGDFHFAEFVAAYA